MRRILERDPAWAAYAIADMQPGFAEQCAWFVFDGGLVMLYHGLTPPILFAMGQQEAVVQALAQAADARQLPGEVYLSIRLEHEDALGRWYDLSAGWTDRRPMVRMVLSEPFAAANGTSPPAPLHAERGEQRSRRAPLSARHAEGPGVRCRWPVA